MPTPFFNWARNQRCRPQVRARPTTEAEVVAVVRAARAAGQRVRVVGAAHSWSAIAMTDEVLVSLDGMQGIVEVNAAAGWVRVQAGIRLHQLNEALAVRGLALPIVGSVDAQSLAGVISTGTHGSSLRHGNLSSYVLGLRLVDGRGNVVELGASHPALPAARVGLGALGIVTEVTYRVVPAFRLRETTEVIPFARAVAELPELARSAEFVKLWWLPHTDGVVVFRCERTDEPTNLSETARWLDEHLVNALLFRGLLALGGRYPAMIPRTNRLVTRTYLSAGPGVGRSDRILTLAMPPRHREVEYAVDLRDGATALQGVRDIIEDQDLRVDFITEVRFVRGDDAWMSPAHGRDTCQLGAYMARREGLDRYFGGFEAMMKALGGRPHWGKELSVTPEEVRGMYPEAWAFAEVVAGFDPEGVFRNGFLERVLPPL